MRFCIKKKGRRGRGMAEMRLLLAAAAAGTVLSASGCSSFLRQDNPTQESRMEEITDRSVQFPHEQHTLLRKYPVPL